MCFFLIYYKQIAGQIAIENAGIQPEEVELIILATATADRLYKKIKK